MSAFAGTQMRSQSGITVVELLIASTILVVMLGSLGGLFVSSSRAYETNRSVTAASGQLRSAVQALQYDVSLAGYCGLGGECALPNALDLNVVGEGSSRQIQSIEAAYVEDRYTTSGGVQRVRYEVVEQRLMRGENGGALIAIADGVTGLELLGYRSSDSISPSEYVYQAPAPGKLAGVDLRLRYLQDGTVRSETLSINLKNVL